MTAEEFVKERHPDAMCHKRIHYLPMRRVTYYEIHISKIPNSGLVASGYTKSNAWSNAKSTFRNKKNNPVNKGI